MTMQTLDTATRIKPSNVIGPYSPWPRRTNRRKAFGLVALVSSVAVFVHCGLPMIA